MKNNNHSYGHFNNYGMHEGCAVNFAAMLDRMGIFKGASVLDVGAGSCWTTRQLADLGCNAIAIDINNSDYFLKNGNGFKRVQGDMNIMPFKENVFDYIVFNNAFHHSKTDCIGEVFRQVYLMLKEDGKLVLIGEPSYGLLSRNYKDTFGEEEPESANENIYPFLKYIKEMRKAGFRNLKLFFPPAIDMKLSTGKFGWKHVSKRVFKLLYYIWRISLVRRIVKKFFVIPAGLIYNFQVHCIAEKK